MVKGISLPVLRINVRGLEVGSSRPIWGDLVRLTYIENPGMAFGIDIGGKLFFSIFSIIASVGILMYLFKARNENFSFRLALAMILGGAVGNLIDRVFYGILFGDAPLFYGKVVDFIDADFFNINILGLHISRWPVFNLADASVSLGVLMLLMFHRKFTQEEQSAIPLAVPANPSGDAATSNGPVGVSNDPRQSPQSPA